MEGLILIVVVLLAITIFLGAAYLIVLGAADIFDKFGPLVLIAWIIGFIPMLVASLIWGGFVLADELGREEREQQRKMAHEEQVRDRQKQQAEAEVLADQTFNEKFIEYCANKTIDYENSRSLSNRSRHDFVEYMVKRFPLSEDLWNHPRASSDLREKVLDALEYPEATHSDVIRAMHMSRTEADFKNKYPRLVQFLRRDVDPDPKWLENERADEEELQKQAAEAKRKKELISKFQSSE